MIRWFTLTHKLRVLVEMEGTDVWPRCSPKAWYESQKAAAESAAVEAVLGEVEELTSGVVEELVSEVLLSPLTLTASHPEYLPYTRI